MLFNSISFFVFFPIVVFFYFLLPHKARTLWLLVSSYYFYMCWNPVYALLIMISTVITFLSGLMLESIPQKYQEPQMVQRLKKTVLVFSFTANLGILGYFKYFNFFIDNINAVMTRLGITFVIPDFDILLPVGISFYTFQALSYTADVYRGTVRAEKNLLKYALFVSFFPQLVAGPIERSGKLLRQIYEKHEFHPEKARDGLLLMMWGYFLKMVIADRIAIFVDAVYADIYIYGGWYLIVASILFAIQIYCDFAGYSTIALGAAQIMGFELTDNFNAPYYSRSTAEFWQRWHISLFGWFRDYIYIPLGGNRKGRVRKYLNIMAVFLVSGIWHGADWAFVLWGALNGAYQIIGDCLRPVRDRLVSALHLDRKSFSHKLFQTVFTFILVDSAWVFFRAGNVTHAVECMKSMLCADNIWILFDDSLFCLGLGWKNFLVMILSIAVLLIADLFKYRGIMIRRWLVEQELWFRWMVYLIGILVIFVFGIYGSAYNEAGFIYFQF